MKRKLLSLFLSILLITSNLASFADTPEIQDSGEGVVKQQKEVTELGYEFESEEVTELAPESGLLVESELQPESGSKLSPEPEPEPELEPEAELEPELETESEIEQEEIFPSYPLEITWTLDKEVLKEFNLSEDLSQKTISAPKTLEEKINIEDYFKEFTQELTKDFEDKTQIYEILFKGILLKNETYDLRKEGEISLEILPITKEVIKLNLVYQTRLIPLEEEPDQNDPEDVAEEPEFELEPEPYLGVSSEEIEELTEELIEAVEKMEEALKSGVKPSVFLSTVTQNVVKVPINPSGSTFFYHVWDKTQDPMTGSTVTMAYFLVDGDRIAFCMNPGLKGPEGNLTEGIFADSQFRRFAENVATVGVTSGGIEGYTFEENFAFAQMYLWKNLPYNDGAGNRYQLDWRYQHSPFETHAETNARYNEWVTKVDSTVNALGKVSFNGETIELKVGEEYRLPDTNGQLHKFNVRNNTDGLSVTQEGDTLVLKASKPISSSDIKFLYNRLDYPTPELTYLLNQPSPEYQDLGSFRDPFVSTLNISARIPTGDVRVIKKGSDEKFIQGAVFELSQDRNFTKSWKSTTGRDGTFLSKDWELELGATVYVREVSVPKEYILDTTIKSVILVAGEIVEVEFINELKTGKARIKKSDMGSGLPVYGAEFELLDPETEIVYTDSVTGREAKWTTNQSNKDGFEVSGLVVGKPYLVRETVVPSGYLEPVVRFTVLVTQGDDVEEFVFLNEKAPKIRTKAIFEGGKKENLPEDNVVVIDLLSYENLLAGKEYSAKGTLVDKSDSTRVISTGETTFTPNASSGTVEVKFTFNASELEGTTMVVFEDLYRDSRLIATHTEIQDKEQTVYIPKIGTKASDILGGNDMYADEKVTIVDVVSYSNLNAGEEYKLKGILMDKSTGSPLLVKGHEVTAEKAFIAESSNGTVDLAFNFDASELKGATVVVFEELYSGDKKVAAHAEIEDEGQTIYIPEIGTKASDILGGNDIFADEEVTILDVVSYSNLSAGEEYKLKGILMDKSTGSPLLSKGQEVTAEKTFIAETTHGEASLEFTFDAIELRGVTIVVFEELYRGDKKVAAHAEIEDLDQTIYIPKIHTWATGLNGSKNIYAGEGVTIVDVVSYSNLITGKEYTVKGLLMNKDTNLPLLPGGNEVTAEKTFVAGTPDGKIDLEFTFSASELKGATIVVFENLYNGEKLVATHSAIDDAQQTVYIPKISTTATSANGAKDVAPNAESKIVDKIEYSNLVPETKYFVKGSLIDRLTNKLIASAEKTFVAESSEGFVELVFTFDASKYAGKEVVVFEEIYEGEHLVATHADLEDKAQTVKVNLAKLPGTGSQKSINYLLSGTVLLLIGLLLLKKKRTRRY